MLIPLIALLSHSHVPSAVPTELVNGRPISWDEFGLVPLDAFHPATSFSKRCLELVAKFDYGTLETICKERLESTDDPVAGWYLAKLAPIRHEEPAMLEFAWKKWQSTKKNGWMVAVEGLSYTVPYSKGFTIRKEDYYKWLPILQATDMAGETQCPELQFQSLRHGRNCIDLDEFRKKYSYLAQSYPSCKPLKVFDAWSHRVTLYFVGVGGPSGNPKEKPHEEGEEFAVAEAMLRAIIKQDPNYSPPYCFLGRVLALRNKRREAESVMKQYLDMKNTLPRLREWAAKMADGGFAVPFRD